MSAELIALSGLILLAAYFIRGTSGFGSGLVAIPIMALWLPLTFVVPLMLLLDFSASVMLSGVNLRQVNWREIRTLIPFSIIGILLGTHLLTSLPMQPMLITLSVFVAIFGFRSLFNLHGDKPISRKWAIPAGLGGGTVGSLFGTGGPPYIIYLGHRISDKTALRATFSGLILIEGSLRISSFAYAGLFSDTRLLFSYLAAMPVVALGLTLGHRAHVGLSREQMMRLIGLLLLGSSISLMVKAFAAQS
ncbi:sulfite exporter TauE/SafE family protein [Sulfuriferula sp. AH1]|uniref:sulfite exporter TauE/SafE family protein n=1 Tax=Sulfuriferula sp. AH1 TaxID=1985873 RepID=UPI001CB95DD0|nr:sulfite exporter TauE/SafE family protein [Sulfuriferula sp. AH1]